MIFSKENDCAHLRDMAAKVAKAMKQDGALAVAQLSHVSMGTFDVEAAGWLTGFNAQSYLRLNFNRLNDGKPFSLLERGQFSIVVGSVAYMEMRCSEPIRPSRKGLSGHVACVP